MIIKNILGVILCGGESKRMGTDKGLMFTGNSIAASYMADKISFLDVPVVFSVNKSQVETYKIYLPERDLIVDNNELKGPVSGLLSVHSIYPTTDILLIACDMLELDRLTISNLVDEYINDNTCDYYVYQDEEYAQPLCGIYTSKGIDKLEASLLEHSLKNISMQYVLNNGITRRLAIHNKAAFKNVNFL